MTDEPAARDTLRISATGHGPNYLPEYYARDRGMFAAAGLDVPYRACDPWTHVLSDLETGAADVVLGGLWVPAMYAGTSRDLVAIGQINARFPKVVLTREAVPNFDWPWLSHKTVLVAGAGGTAPYEFPAGLIREAGVELVGTRFARDLSGEMYSELWRQGLGDAYFTDLFTAVTLTHEGHGHIALRMAERGGLMPNSVYYVKRERLDELRERLTRFMAVITAAMAALSVAEDLRDAVDVAVVHWPATSPAVLEEVVADMAGNGTWSSSTIDPDACGRWIRMLGEAGLLLGDVSAADILDTSITEPVIPTRV